MSFAESKRTNFKLDLLKLKDFKMSKVGEWTPLSGLNITDRYAFLQGKSFLFFLCYTHTVLQDGQFTALKEREFFGDFKDFEQFYA